MGFNNFLEDEFELNEVAEKEEKKHSHFVKLDESKLNIGNRIQKPRKNDTNHRVALNWLLLAVVIRLFLFVLAFSIPLTTKCSLFSHKMSFMLFCFCFL